MNPLCLPRWSCNGWANGKSPQGWLGQDWLGVQPEQWNRWLPDQYSHVLSERSYISRTLSSSHYPRFTYSIRCRQARAFSFIFHDPFHLSSWYPNHLRQLPSWGRPLTIPVYFVLLRERDLEQDLIFFHGRSHVIWPESKTSVRRVQKVEHSSQHRNIHGCEHNIGYFGCIFERTLLFLRETSSTTTLATSLGPFCQSLI